MAHRIERLRPHAEEQARAEARRFPGIALRFVLVGQHRVEHMRAETGFRRMAGITVFVAEQAVQPAIDFMPGGKIINQLDMAIAAIEFLPSQKIVDVQGDGIAAFQIAEFMFLHLIAARIINQRLDRQMRKRGGHRRRQRPVGETVRRQHRRRYDMQFAKQLAEIAEPFIGLEIIAFHIRVRDAGMAVLR